MSTRSFVVPLIAVALCGPGLAADLPAPLPPAAELTWAGFYIGSQVGYAWGRQNVSFFPTGVGSSLPGVAATYNPNGVIGGVHAGYNYQIKSFVYGLEGDVDGASVQRTFVQSPGVSFATHSPVQGSLRGRIGIGLDRWLVYAAGGYALASITDEYASAAFSNSFSKVRGGWTVGGGLDYAAGDHWLVRGEYRYTDFEQYSDKNLFYSSNFVKHHLTEQAVLIGFSYKFDPAAPVVVAKH